MPKFELNKLVRDGYIKEYSDSNQKAEYHKLTKQQHLSALIAKIIEEATELASSGDESSRVSEIADILQAVDDYAKLCDINKEAINDKINKKYNSRGGFTAGVFVHTIELLEDDPWLDYYRSNPTVFPEKKE